MFSNASRDGHSHLFDHVYRREYYESIGSTLCRKAQWKEISHIEMHEKKNSVADINKTMPTARLCVCQHDIATGG
jgi:hypothetical protein